MHFLSSKGSTCAISFMHLGPSGHEEHHLDVTFAWCFWSHACLSSCSLGCLFQSPKSLMLVEFPPFPCDRTGVLLSEIVHSLGPRPELWVPLLAPRVVEAKGENRKNKTRQQTCLTPKWQVVIQRATKSEVSEADFKLETWRKRSLELGNEYKKKKIGQEAASVLRQSPEIRVSPGSATTSSQVESLCAVIQLAQGIKVAEGASGGWPLCISSAQRLRISPVGWAQVKWPSIHLAALWLLDTSPPPPYHSPSSPSQIASAWKYTTKPEMDDKNNKRKEAEVRGQMKRCWTKSLLFILNQLDHDLGLLVATFPQNKKDIIRCRPLEQDSGQWNNTVFTPLFC